MKTQKRMNSRQMKRKFGSNTKELLDFYHNIKSAHLELKEDFIKSGETKITIDVADLDKKMDGILHEFEKSFPPDQRIQQNVKNQDEIKINFKSK